MQITKSVNVLSFPPVLTSSKPHVTDHFLPLLDDQRITDEFLTDLKLRGTTAPHAACSAIYAAVGKTCSWW
jgi:hypothetical protein